MMFLATSATAAARQQRQLLGLRCFASSAGLFGIEQLRQPEDFRKLVETTKARCSALVEEAVSAPSSIEAIRKTDELSDTICKTYDAAELCRNVHMSSQWQAEAQNACISLGGFLAHLNVHQGLYNAVASAVSASCTDAAAPQAPHPHGSTALDQGGAATGQPAAGSPPAGAGGSLPAAALRVGQLLLQDFEAHGVHLQGDAQRRFLDASAREQMLCMQFGQNLGTASKYGWFNMSTKAADQLAHLSPNARVQVERNGRTLRVPTHEAMLQEVLTRVPESYIRRQAYHVGYTSPRGNLAVVQRLLDTRQEIAELLAAPSYAHYQAGRDTLAQHPAAISTFLKGLGEAVRDKAQEEVRLLQRHSGSTAAPEAWDEQYLRAKAQAAQGLTGTPALCTLPDCLGRLDYLCRRLLNVRLASVPLAAGEAWAPDLQKLALVDGSSKEEIGHLYLDLYARSGKVQGPGVQFTLVNGRQLPDGSHQRPCVALVCNFPPGAAAPLSVVAVQTLFHEFGHVLNALLSTTEFQHVAGTRGTADTVELASQLFEYFVEDPRVFGGDSAPEAALKQHAAQQRMFAALEVQRQVLYARLDQELHLNGGVPPQGDLVHHLMAETLSFPPVRGLKPQARFAHLAAAGGHGSKYYSYLYSKAFAAAVWETHLAGDPFHAAAGQHLREKLLSVGLSVAPQQMITDLLGDPAVIPCAEAGFYPDSRHLLAEIGA